MKPISKQPSHPVITIGDPYVERGRQKIPLHWQDNTYEVEVPIPNGQDQPPSRKTSAAIMRGIDRFHKRIRESSHSEEREDLIRKV